MRLPEEHSQPDSRAGFTLLELIVVLAILAGVMMIATPRLGGVEGRASLQSSALKLAADLRATHAEAMRNNIEKTFTVEVMDHSYRSDSQPNPQRIPKNIEVTMSGKDVEWIGDSAGRIRFQPEGSATQATIILKQDRRQANITVDWLTGAVHLSWQS